MDPGVEALRYSGPRDQEYGVRVVIGPERAWYSTETYSGVAHVGALGSLRSRPGIDEPAFVFATGWVLVAPVRIADVASHEVGHTFGLRHDGLAGPDGNSDDYARGDGLWGPIMGSPFKVPLSQWSRGEYAGATNAEDDVAIIGAVAGFVPDDVAGRPEALVPGVPADRLIGRATDRDAFLVRVDEPATLTVTVAPVAPAPLGNLNAALQLRDATGTVVASDSPTGPDAYGATVTVELAPGSYVAVVDGVGEDGPGGFGDYGSLGRYRITAQMS